MKIAGFIAFGVFILALLRRDRKRDSIEDRLNEFRKSGL